MNKKLVKFSVRLIILLAVGLYFIVSAYILNVTGIGCVFKHFLGIPCPGCGMTSALLACLRLDFSSAARHNPLIFAAPYIVVYQLIDIKPKKLADGILIAIGAAAVLNWIIRLFIEVF